MSLDMLGMLLERLNYVENTQPECGQHPLIARLLTEKQGKGERRGTVALTFHYLMVSSS